MDKTESWIAACNAQAQQAETALTYLGNHLHLACREISHTPPGELRPVLAQLRAIRAPFASYMKEYAPFEDKAARALVDFEAETHRPALAAPAALENTAKKGTPQYERLRARQGWPYLISPEAAAQVYGIAADVYYNDQPTEAARGSFDSKTFQVRTKFEKWAKKRASALHHLCIILSEFQRPGDRTFGGGPGKRAIAELIRDYVEEWHELDRQVVAAILEAVDR